MRILFLKRAPRGNGLALLQSRRLPFHETEAPLDLADLLEYLILALRFHALSPFLVFLVQTKRRFIGNEEARVREKKSHAPP